MKVSKMNVAVQTKDLQFEIVCTGSDRNKIDEELRAVYRRIQRGDRLIDSDEEIIWERDR